MNEAEVAGGNNRSGDIVEYLLEGHAGSEAISIARKLAATLAVGNAYGEEGPAYTVDTNSAPEEKKILCPLRCSEFTSIALMTGRRRFGYGQYALVRLANATVERSPTNCNRTRYKLSEKDLTAKFTAATSESKSPLLSISKVKRILHSQIDMVNLPSQ